MSEIPNALTSDEWKAMLADDQFPGGLLPPLVRIQSVRDENAVGDYLFKMVATFNAALPDDDPRKITREDVALLRETAETVRIHGEYNDDVFDDDEREPLYRLAAKLAALLPP